MYGSVATKTSREGIVIDAEADDRLNQSCRESRPATTDMALSPEQEAVLASLVDPDSPEGVKAKALADAAKSPFNTEVDVAAVLVSDAEAIGAVAGVISHKLFMDHVCGWIADIAAAYWQQYGEMVPEEVVRRELWSKVEKKPDEIKASTIDRMRQVYANRPKASRYMRDRTLAWCRQQAARRAVGEAWEKAKDGGLDLAALRKSLVEAEQVGKASKPQWGTVDLWAKMLPPHKWVVKTVADCFKYRNKIGLDVAIEALRDCWRKKKATMDQLHDAAKVCRVAAVMRPYMEMLI